MDRTSYTDILAQQYSKYTCTLLPEASNQWGCKTSVYIFHWLLVYYRCKYIGYLIHMQAPTLTMDCSKLPWMRWCWRCAMVEARWREPYSESMSDHVTCASSPSKKMNCSDTSLACTHHSYDASNRDIVILKGSKALQIKFTLNSWQSIKKLSLLFNFCS